MVFSNETALNVTETFCNLYVLVDCPEQDYVGFEIQVFIAKKYLINRLRGWNILTVSLKTVY